MRVEIAQLHEEAEFVKYDDITQGDLVAAEVWGLNESLVKHGKQLDEIGVPFRVLLLRGRRWVLARITKDSEDLLTGSGHLGLMPPDDSLDFLFVLGWEQLVSDSLVVFADIDVDDVVAAHHFVLAFLDHGNVASWVDGKIFWSLVLLLKDVQLIELDLDARMKAAAHDGSGLIIKNTSMECQWLVFLLLCSMLRSAATHF